MKNLRLLALLMASAFISKMLRFAIPAGSIGFALMLGFSASPRLSFAAQPNFLVIRLSHEEGKTWSEPTLLADRPAKVGGWFVCYPTLTELADGTLIAIWTQINSSPGELYGDIRSARIVLNK
jgi:hypothetical protein